MMIDLGANTGALINLEKYDIEVEIIESQGTSIAYDAKGNAFPVRQFIVPALEVGELEAIRVAGIETKYDPGFAPPVDNALGYVFFDKYNLLMDYGNKEVILSEGNDFIQDPEEWDAISFDGSKDSIITKCVISGKEYNCLWDTGATSNFIKTEVAEEILGKSLDTQLSIDLSLKLGNPKMPVDISVRNIDVL